MSNYYPEFYVKKRQREQAYRKASFYIFGIAGIVILGVVSGYFFYNNVVATSRIQPGASPELAAMKQELEVQERISETSAAAREQADLQDASAPAIELSSLEYAASFPTIQVSVEGTVPVQENAAEAAAVPGEAVLDPPVDGSALPPGDQSGVVSPNEESQSDPGETDSRYKPERKLDESATEKKPVAEKPVDKPKEKPKPKTEAKPKPADPKPVVTPPVSDKGATKFSYRVYAGKFLGREDAEKAQQDLGALGLAGNIVDSAGDYLVLVANLDDYDSATALKDKLSGSGFGKAFVTRKSAK